MKGDFGGIDAMFRTPPGGAESRFFVSLDGQQLLATEVSLANKYSDLWTYTSRLTSASVRTTTTLTTTKNSKNKNNKQATKTAKNNKQASKTQHATKHNNNNNNPIWTGSVVTGEEPPPHSRELNHALCQVGGPTQPNPAIPLHVVRTLHVAPTTEDTSFVKL